MALQVLKWSDQYKTGVRVIDNDHKLLFDLTEGLVACAEGNINGGSMGEIIDRLVTYANEHFAREEQFMANCGYPALEDHIAEHRRAADEIYGIRQLFRSHPEELDPRKVAQFFTNWLANHIQARDLRYVPYVRGDESAMADGPPETLRTRPADSQSSMPLETVSVDVPDDKAEFIRTCAGVLTAGGAAADKLVEILSKMATASGASKRLERISKRYSR